MGFESHPSTIFVTYSMTIGPLRSREETLPGRFEDSLGSNPRRGVDADQPRLTVFLNEY